jgi:flagellar biosynthesis anti-sigma factor FlgM
MDIRDIQTGPSQAPEPARRVAKPNAAPKDTTPQDTSKVDPGQEQTPDRVVMSRAARALDEMRQTALASAEVREARVEHIRRAIADGTYGPDPERTARALVAQGMLG